MVIGKDELDRIADDMYKDRRISTSVYCGECGYNLKTLPYAARCPECGSEYNARALTMRGIFTMRDIELPFKEGFVTLLCVGSAYILARNALSPPDHFRLALAVCFAAFAVMYFRETVNRTGRYFKAASIMRRIREEEESLRD